MNLNLTITQIPLVISIFIRIITAIVFLAFIIPLQIKEATVKNGLKKLRIELLATGITIFFVNTVGLILVILKFFVEPSIVQAITDILTVFNTFGFLGVAILQYNIYHHRYTPEQKELHEKFSRMEITAENKARKKAKKHLR